MIVSPTVVQFWWSHAVCLHKEASAALLQLGQLQQLAVLLANYVDCATDFGLQCSYLVVLCTLTVLSAAA
jgi:hypothetical protein